MESQTLMTRLERLERQNRIMRAAFAIVCIIALTIATANHVTAFPQDIAVKSILAEEFVLVDSRGETLGRWQVQSSVRGQRFPQLQMVHDSYKTDLSPHSLVFFSDRSKIASLYINESSLGFRDNHGTTRTLLDRHGLSLHGPQENVRALFGSVGSDILRTSGTSIRSGSDLLLFDANGKVIFKAPVNNALSR